MGEQADSPRANWHQIDWNHIYDALARSVVVDRIRHACYGVDYAEELKALSMIMVSELRLVRSSVAVVSRSLVRRSRLWLGAALGSGWRARPARR